MANGWRRGKIFCEAEYLEHAATCLASRGPTRIRHCAEPGLSDDELKDYRRHSRRLVALGLPKERQREFGLDRR
jgi:hypothetical protein